MSSSIKKIGILTGGGDCPGINAVLRAVVRRARLDDVTVMGIKKGWQGLIENDLELLTRNAVSGILPRGGTIIGTSRVNPLAYPERLEAIRETWQKHSLDALIVVGGDGTLSAARRMFQEQNFPIVGIPKTIDNDLCGTDYTVGMDSAVSIVAESIDRLHSTAESHHRVMVVEVMGRHCGWLATLGAIAGGADVVLVPEEPFRISEVCGVLRQRLDSSRQFSIVVVSEDARPHPDEDFLSDEQKRAIYNPQRLGGIGPILAEKIQSATGIDARATILGYMQRGGSPSAFDRILATRMGIHAVEMVLQGAFGRMTAMHGMEITSVPLEEAVANIKTLDPEFYRIARIFAG